MTHQADEWQSLMRAARTARVETTLLVECLQRRVISLTDAGWDDEAIEEARRVRRLMGLGVNIQGVEVIFHMRRSLSQMQQEMARLQEEMDALRRLHEQERARLLREVAREG